MDRVEKSFQKYAKIPEPEIGIVNVKGNFCESKFFLYEMTDFFQSLGFFGRKQLRLAVECFAKSSKEFQCKQFSSIFFFKVYPLEEKRFALINNL